MSGRTSIQRYALVAAAVGIAAGLAQATMVASFADPTIGTSPIKYMFSIRDGAPGTITETPGAPSVSLYLDPSTGAGGLHTGVDLVISSLTYTGGFMAGGSIGPGSFEFLEQGQPLLRIDFDNAYLSRWNIGGDDIFSASNVQFTVQGQPLLIEPYTGSFTFSFSNQKPYPGAPASTTGFDATSAFNCSADVMPEPASSLILAMGAGLSLWRRR